MRKGGQLRNAPFEVCFSEDDRLGNDFIALGISYLGYSM